MEINEFIMHKNRWLNGWNHHMKLGDINFKTYMRMKGMTEEEFTVLEAKAAK